MKLFKKLIEGADEHEVLKNPAKNPFHSLLTQYGFHLDKVTHEKNQFAPASDAGKSDYTQFIYKHPQHGKTFVAVWLYHTKDRRGRDKTWIMKWEQSNGIMAPTSGDTKPQLAKTLASYIKSEG